MDRNQITGLILVALLFVTWMFFFGPEENKQKQNPQPSAQDTTTADLPSAATDTLAEAPPQPPDVGATDSLPRAAADTTGADSLQLAQEADRALERKFGIFAPAAKGEDATVRVTTDRFNLAITARGGQIKPVRLREFETWDDKPLPVVPENNGTEDYYVFAVGGLRINTNDLYFKPMDGETVEVTGEETKVVRMRAEIAPEVYLERRYAFTGESYGVEQDFILAGLQDRIRNNQFYYVSDLTIPRTEKDREKMLQETNIYYKLTNDDDVESIDLETEEPSEEESVKTPLKWVGMKSQFFSHAIIAREQFENAQLQSFPVAKNKEANVKRLYAEMELPYRHLRYDTTRLTFYYGPNDVYIMDDYAEELDELTPLGWGPLRYIALGILSIFKLLEKFIGSYGAIIAILALFVKLLLTPLTFRSFQSQARMQVVNQTPEIKKLEEKYKDDAQALQQEKMKFYNQVGVNPLGGCLPLFLQFPILISMFNFFPHSIELRQEGFLWADDLSTYDSILDLPFAIPFYGDHVSLFTLLMTITNLVYTYIQQKSQGNSGPAQLKYIGYIMPVVFLGVLNSYSAGLSYYYFVFTLLTIIQTVLMKKFFIDEEKIKQQIHDLKTGKVKKKKGRISKFMEQQQAKQEEMLRQRNKQSGRGGGGGGTKPQGGGQSRRDRRKRK